MRSAHPTAISLVTLHLRTLPSRHILPEPSRQVAVEALYSQHTAPPSSRQPVQICHRAMKRIRPAGGGLTLAGNIGLDGGFDMD